MKKKIALMLACLMASTALFACGPKEKEANNQAEKETAVVAEDTIEEAAVEKQAGTAPTYAITSVTADGYEFYAGFQECIQITDSDHEELKKSLEEFFNGMVSNFNEGIDALNEEAKGINKDQKEYAEEQGLEYEPIKYIDNNSVNVVRADDKIISFTVASYMDRGGAHGSTVYSGYTFDVNTGKQLTLENFGDKDKIVEVSKAYILSIIEESDDSAKEMLYNDEVTSYKSAIDETFSNGYTPEYVIDNRGIRFYFQPYDIAPYAAGLISFNVPFYAIDGFNEEYIPVDEFYTFQLSALGLIDKIDVDNDGELDTVSVTNELTDEGGDGLYHVNVKDKSVKQITSDYANISASYVHSKEGNFIIVECYGKSVTAYEVSNGIKEVGTIELDDETKTIKEIKDGELVIATATYEDENIKWGEAETHTFTKNSFN
ncbi:Protein of unknown function (DUF3298) [Butyrivibrio fibrisolvens 16/4]|nr:Protein of unknown function (DUF3298) [Butyrivibrio fibrisolvens 16/4]